MKNLSAILLLLSMFLFACGSGSSKSGQKESESAQEEATELKSGEKISNCEEFLDKYEKWIDNYLVVLEKYKKNPMDAQLAQEFSKVAMEASTWAEQWSNNYLTCVNNERYQKRFEEISEKVDKKMKELGFE